MKINRMIFLKEQRRKYIFQDPPTFSPVEQKEVVGVEIILSEVNSIIERIRNFRELNALGIDIGGGALFWGRKGTGKTYCAQYLATATKNYARFIDIRGFPAQVIGRGDRSSLTAADIREIFRLSEEYVKTYNLPLILCYDEFEEVEGEILTELRIKLSGLEKRLNGIYLLLISTSDPQELDERLFRPGRISDIIHFKELTPRGQCEVLRFAVSRRPHDPNIDFESIVHISDEIDTPAALVEIANAAYLEACREKKYEAKIEQRHLITQYLRSAAGQATEETLSEKELSKIALHEAGHVVLALLLGIPLRFTSILPELRNPEKHGQTNIEIPQKVSGIEDFLNFLAFKFGGLVGETLFGYRGLLTLGDDIHDITFVVDELVEKLGFGQEINRRYSYMALRRSLNEYSNELKQMAERDKGRLIKLALRRAWQTVENTGKEKVRVMIENVAKALLKKKILIRNEIEGLFNESRV